MDTGVRAALAGLGLLLAWDASGLDLSLASLAGSAQGFRLRDAWILAGPLHEGARALAVGVALACMLGVWFPAGPLRKLGAHRRVQLAATVVLAALAVSTLKSVSFASCPWDLAQFGGSARYVSHWSLEADGGSGRCFPAGHASAGFAFLGGYFAFHRTDGHAARAWLVAALAAGLLLGLVQQLRGAHFMSHTLWTAWTCWVVAWLVDRAATATERGA